MTAAAPRHRRRWQDPRQWWLWLSGLVGSRYDGLHHFHVVTPGVLLRCGQPRIRDLQAIARDHGLRSVFVARGGTRHPLRGRWFRIQRDWCAARGIRFFHEPFSDAAAPPADIFERFLAVLADPANRPVLVHCEQGWHRTGVLCAAHRIANEGWTLDAAVEEMVRLGYEADRPKRRPLLAALERWSTARPSPR
ncbi:MAG: dual specificity protein phosphatase family protein [Phycisphaerales bacterium]|nr:dual specificity protein phosphatase family protein [Phycisphaerales bacterium]